MCFQELFYGPYFCQVQDTAFFSFFFSRVEGWAEPEYINGRSYHAPYVDWRLFQSVPAQTYSKKVKQKLLCFC